MSSARQSLPADQRPFDATPVDTDQLPPTPTRDRNIAASAWRQAPAALLNAGEPLGIAQDRIAYKRRLGDWLLWRAGPARGPAIYVAVNRIDVDRLCTLTINADGTHHGVGPTGREHERFRAWKEDLLGR